VFFLLRKELLGPQPIAQLNETVETGRRSTFVARLKTVDIGGQLLFLFGFGLLILALTWAGGEYRWETVAVLVPLVLGSVITCAFVYWEKQMAPGGKLAERLPYQKSMIPWEVLKDRNMALLFYISFATGMAMYSVRRPYICLPLWLILTFLTYFCQVFYFCNLYFTLVKVSHKEHPCLSQHPSYLPENKFPLTC
jgi:hypothetical protein